MIAKISDMALDQIPQMNLNTVSVMTLASALL